MIFDPTTNRVQMYLLTEEEIETLKVAEHGWEFFCDGKWYSADNPGWYGTTIYRAKPAPVVKSVWVNVYPADEFENEGIYVSPARLDRRTTDGCAKSTRIGVARFDLIDGVLSVELEPLEEDNG